MINLRSPFYITTPFVSPSLGYTCAKYKLEVYVWSGLVNAAPTSPTYSITKNNPTASTGDDTINISRITKDFIDFVPLDSSGTDLLDSDNQVWIKTSIFYAENLTDSFSILPENTSTVLGVLGYGYGMDGENPPTPTNKVLMRIGEYTMINDGKFVVPIQLDETTPPAPEIVITGVTEDADPLYDVAFTYVGSYTEFYAIVEPAVGVPTVEIFDITSPQQISVSYDGDVDVTMYGYDSYSNTDVVSNTYNFTTV